MTLSPWPKSAILICMKRSLAISVGTLGLLAILSGWGYHHWQRDRQLLRFSDVARHYLVASAMLPNIGAVHTLHSMTVPNSQARILTNWLEQQDDQSSLSFRVRRAHLDLVHLKLSTSSTTPVLSGTYSLHRQFWPRGSNQVQGTFHIWFQSGKSLKIEEVSINTDPTTHGPDPINLNLWNQVPAGVTPHGQ